jgi:hypothetical protein
MADVEMADAAPAGDDKKKVVPKTAKAAAADGAVDNKKKFEVKKVRPSVVVLTSGSIR